MTYNFLRGGRDQPFLLPPTCATGSLKAIAWFVLDVVDQFDTAPFCLATATTGTMVRRSECSAGHVPDLRAAVRLNAQVSLDMATWQPTKRQD